MRTSYLLLLFLSPVWAQTVPVPLMLDPGVPLRLYLTRRLPMKLGAPVTAKVIEPVYSFDRVVIPPGSEVSGTVTRLDPVGKLVRAQALMGGDFTPLHRARVEFNDVKLPDGRMLPIHTESAVGLPTIYTEPKPPKHPKPATASAAPKGDPGLKGQLEQGAKREINAQIDSQLNAHTYGLGSLVRGPNKLERLEDFAYRKMPYHPQFYRKGTRFDAVLDQSLDFGSAAIAPEALTELATDSRLDRVVQIRFLTDVSSANAKVGDPVEAVLSEPLMSDANKLVLPEGTHLTGTVRMAQHARWLHRMGRLRFNFDQLTLPPAVASLPRAPMARADARLVSAETDPAASVKVDSEGSAKATESKARLLGPAITSLIALKALDNDYGKTTAAGGNGSSNGGALALGGFSGFGLLGVAASRLSVTAGSALGVWGMAVSVYNGILSPGHEVEFHPNSSMVVRFGARPVPEATKLVAGH